MSNPLCDQCFRPRHFCQACGEFETGHYGGANGVNLSLPPVKLCDDCRWKESTAMIAALEGAGNA